MKRVFKSVKSLSKIKKLLLGILVGIMILVGFGLGYSRYLFSISEKQLPNLERTIDEFLTYQSKGEYKKSYDLFTDETKKSEDLDAFIKKSNYIIRPAVSHYMRNSLLKEDFVINFFIGQPITLVYQGNIFYEDREKGLVIASFILKNNQWELYGIQITAPKSRLDKYNPQKEIE